jgi:hypothetical protein
MLFLPVAPHAGSSRTTARRLFVNEKMMVHIEQACKTARPLAKGGKTARHTPANSADRSDFEEKHRKAAGNGQGKPALGRII